MAKIKALQASTGVSAGTVTELSVSGSGEVNYIVTPSDASSGWTASSSAITVATDTTTAELPRQITEASGFKITGVSGSTAYVYYRFTLDRSDYGRKLKVTWDQAPISGYAASDFKVDVYSNTASDYTGTSTRLSLSTDSSSISAIPNLTGTYRTTFDAPSSTAPYIELRIGLNGTNTHACVFSNVVVGPGIVTQGAAVGEWQSCTATFTNLAGTQTAVMRRIGDSMHLRAKSVLSGVAGGTMLIDIPSGYTHDTTKYNGASGTRVKIGTVTFWDASASATYNGDVVYIIGTGVRFYGGNNQTIWNATSPVASVSTDEVSVDMVVPIAEWSGNGTVNVAQNDVEYAYNSSTSTTTSDTSSFAYGPAGAAIQGITAALSRRVRFQTPIQSTDVLVIEISNGGSLWTPVGTQITGSSVDNLRNDGTNDIGVGFDQAASMASTDVDVRFGKYRTGTANTWAGVSSVLWRVRKMKGGQAVGFGLADSSGNAGLANPYTEGSGVIYANSYTPTLYNTTNMAASSLIGAQYQRVGKIVTVFGSVDADPTSAATITELGISLPVASNLSTTADLFGVASQRQVGGVYVSAKVDADTTNDRAIVRWVTGSDVAQREIHFSFSYIIR